MTGQASQPLEGAKTVRRGRSALPSPPRPEVMALVDVVAAERRVTADEICGLSLERPAYRARHEVWRRLKAAGWSISGIARAWGCHGSTICTAISPTGKRR